VDRRRRSRPQSLAHEHRLGAIRAGRAAHQAQVRLHTAPWLGRDPGWPRETSPLLGGAVRSTELVENLWLRHTQGPRSWRTNWVRERTTPFVRRVASAFGDDHLYFRLNG